MSLTYLKLNGSYIKDLTSSPKEQTFVKGIYYMTNAFGMKSIAEINEDESTLKLLDSLRVDYS